MGTFLIDDLDLNVLTNYIDWTPFFITWELHGRFPKILKDKVVGEEATNLYADAKVMLNQIIEEKWSTVFGKPALQLMMK